jgi:hypothetical protein
MMFFLCFVSYSDGVHMELPKEDIEKLEHSCKWGGYGMKGRRAWVFAPLWVLVFGISFRIRNGHAPSSAVFFVLFLKESMLVGSWALKAVD